MILAAMVLPIGLSSVFRISVSVLRALIYKELVKLSLSRGELPIKSRMLAHHFEFFCDGHLNDIASVSATILQQVDIALLVFVSKLVVRGSPVGLAVAVMISIGILERPVLILVVLQGVRSLA